VNPSDTAPARSLDADSSATAKGEQVISAGFCVGPDIDITRLTILRGPALQHRISLGRHRFRRSAITGLGLS
jgi:hypothetical protein